MKVFEWIKRLFRGPAAPPEKPGQREGRPVSAVVRRPARLSDLLQFEEKPSGLEVDVVIGLDFGTSSAKVALQTPYKLGGQVTFVDFGPLAHPSARHLLPVALHVSVDGSLSLERPADHLETRGHLKLELLARDGQRSPRREQEGSAWAAAFLALTLRAARRHLIETQWEAYGHDKLRWSFNLGIPSAGYDDDAIRERFLLVARAGWSLSLRGTAPTLATATAAVEHAASGLGGGEDIDVIPEVAAEVVGYARSRRRRDGLHVVLDIGASTLDVCSFSLHSKHGDDVYSLLTADVQLLGLLELHSRRMEAAGGIPPFDGVPRDLVQPLPGPESIAEASIRRAIARCDEAFAESARQVLARTLLDLKSHRDPHAPAWREGLPLFVSGGGASSEVVGSLIRGSDDIGRKIWVDYAGLRRQAFPFPAEVSPGEGLTDGEFARLCVAFGLSFPSIKIGTIEAPQLVPDVEISRGARDWQRAYVDKDQV